MDLKIYSRTGEETGRTVSLDESIFGIEPNDHAIWLDVRSVQANKRQGTHKAKERGEVAYSRRKLYRQKGTGNARAGDAKSPIRVGGGTIFGPRPHKYTVGVNKKTKRLARRSAFAYKAQGEALRVLEDFAMDVPKTRDVASLLGSLGVADQKVLILTADVDDTLYRSARNLPKVSVRPAANASTEDVLGAKVVLLQEGALAKLSEVLGEATPEAA